MTNLPIVVIGAGPVGLATVAHLIDYGETPLIFEAGESVGQNMLSWAHVRMFSPWQYTVDKVMVKQLEATGWEMPPLDGLPTGGDLVTGFLRPFADLPTVKEALHLNSKVIAISRLHTDKMKDESRDDLPFVLHVEDENGDDIIVQAKAVIDASGTWHNPKRFAAKAAVLLDFHNQGWYCTP